MRLRWGVLLIAALGAGCSASRVVRLDTGTGEFIVHVPRTDVAPVRLERGEFKEAVTELARDVRPFEHPLKDARRLFGVPSRSGSYLYDGRSQRLISLDEGEDTAQGIHFLDPSEELTLAYQRWCEHRNQRVDCLQVLEEGPLLGSDGKYALAMAIAMDSVWDETAEALKGMADPQALLATVTSAVTMYLMLWAMPEPVSKGVAAVLTAIAISYLGVDTVWRIIDGWVELVRKLDRVTTFDELHHASTRYAKVLGQSSARIFVMLTVAALGNTAALASNALKLPGSAQAALAVEGQAGYPYIAVGAVQSVAFTAEGFTIALGASALAMSSQETSGSGGGEHKHHIATIRNEKSAAQGGPWTPRFRQIFKKAGMELKDPENVVPLKGHKGPHPQEYHEAVYEKLRQVTKSCRSISQCRQVLEEALKRLAQECTTPGTNLNRLLTQKKGR